MKRRLGLILAAAALMCFIFTACGAPKTLEEFMANDSDAMAQLESMEDQNKGLDIEIKDNTITYTYDISELGYSKSTAKAAKDQIQKSLDSSSDSYTSLAAQLEEESGLSGIEIVVNYTYKDSAIASGTFTASEE